MRARRAILEALYRADAWTFGLALIRAGVMSRGMGYVWLNELEEAGYVRSRNSGDEFGRKQFQITSAGRAALLRDDL